MADQRRPPLVIAGMHRSGTSLTAAMLAACNLDVGPALLPADAANRAGYFEDVEFVALNGRMLVAATPDDDAGHRDWGWTESGTLDRSRFETFAEEARTLYARRSGQGRLWGWKDPRTTRALDFWDAISGHAARFLLLYRFPWEVADSMQRLGARVFLDHPDYAYRIWEAYNRDLLDFHRRHPGRSLLIGVNALVNAPDRLLGLLGERLGLALSRPPAPPAVDPERFSYLGTRDPLIDLVMATHPGCAALLEELDTAADLSAAGLWSSSPPSGRRLDGRLARGAIGLSIVVPTCDDGELLVEAVASVERCASDDSELVVVNDGSRAQRTLEILEVLRACGYHVVDQENAGLAAARNRGIEVARGRYLLPLDADNRLRPDFPRAAIAVLERAPDVGVVYGGRLEFGLRTCAVEVAAFDLDRILRANYIDACAVMRREVWEQCGGYDGAMPFMGFEDWDLWLGAAERGWRFHRLEGLTFDYRVRPDSMAMKLWATAKSDALRTYIFDKHHDLYRRRLPALLTAQYEAAEIRLPAEAPRCDERDRLYAELDAWRRRVAFMESTSAWRARGLLLRLLGRAPAESSE